MKLEACIFDLDGVIVDTAGYHYLAWKRIGTELGFDFTEEMNETMKGISRYDSLGKLLEFGNITISEEEKQRLCVVKNDYYLDSLSDMNHENILPGVVSLLDELKEKNVKIALGSASKNAIKVLDLIGIKERFEVIVDGNSVSRSKPDPEVFIKGATELGVSPAHTIVFEDSNKGLDAAIAGGFKTVGLGSPEHLGHADIVLPGLGEVSLSDILHQLTSTTMTA